MISSFKLKIHIGDYLIEKYYIFVMSFYFLSMFFSVIRPGVSASILMCLILISNFKSFSLKKDTIHSIFLIYVVYNLFTGLFFLWNKMPFSVYYTEFSSSILPVMFFFIGKKSQDKFEDNSFYKYFAISVLIMLIVGVYYYFLPNENFLNYMRKITANFTIQNYWKDKRLESFVGSTELGSLSAILVVISLKYIISNGLKIKYVVLYIFSAVCSSLSMQRSSMVISFAMIIAWHFYGISKNKINHKFVIAEITIFILFVIQLLRIDPNILNLLVNKLTRIGTAVSERSDSWVYAIHNSSNIFLGSGLGCAGHKAIGYAKYFVNDGSFVKILVETGILGFLLFITVIVYTYAKFLFINKNRVIEISIVSILLFQAIGSNVLAFQTLLPVFWYSIGRIWNNARL